MRAKVLLLTLLLPCSVLADGMVGVPDPAAARITPARGADASGPRRSIVIEGGGDAALLERRLAEHYARQARETADSDARRRTQEAEMSAALLFARGNTGAADREARDAADAQARARQRELELEAAATAALLCGSYERNVGCRSPQVPPER